MANKPMELTACSSRFFVRAVQTRHPPWPQLTSTLGELTIGLDSPPDQGYTTGMKTAISLPKDVFDKAERLAKRTRKFRSQLYCEAIREYIARHSPDEITEALDLVVEENGQPEDGFVKLASARTLARVDW